MSLSELETERDEGDLIRIDRKISRLCNCFYAILIGLRVCFYLVFFFVVVSRSYSDSYSATFLRKNDFVFSIWLRGTRRIKFSAGVRWRFQAKATVRSFPKSDSRARGWRRAAVFSVRSCFVPSSSRQNRGRFSFFERFAQVKTASTHGD